MTKTFQLEIEVEKIVTLKRNPQYLTPKQMESLKKSIEQDGFCVPILVRKIDDERYETISGNHRFMAACELDYKKIPCVVANLSDKAAQRLAINLNTVHGEPNVELLAPFLAEMEDDVLFDIHIENDLKKSLLEFDANLSETLSKMSVSEKFNRDSSQHKNSVCVCPKCGRKHFENTEV